MGGFSSAADEERLTITPPFFSSILGSMIFVIYVQLEYDSMSGEVCMCECQELERREGAREGET